MTDLNAAQRKAAETLAGPVVVDAGAGSGKTRALAQRFVNAVDPRSGVPAWRPTTVDRLVAITFTDKAAGELAERIRESLRAQPGLQEQARRVDVAWISTIHGFCSRLLRENALLAGVDPRFAVADPGTAAELAEAAFEQVAREAMASDVCTERLFGEYGYERVVSAVVRIRRELIKRGMPAEALDLEPVVDAGDLAAEAVAVVNAAVKALESCADGRRTVDHGIALCRDVSERLCAPDLEMATPEQVGHAVWRELQALPKSVPVRHGDAADVLRGLVDARARLRQEGLALALRPFSAALLSLVRVYSDRFAEAKAERSLLDFDDLQTGALRLAAEHPELARAYREQFDLVMVDEFQDTDSLQLAVVRAFGGPNLCVVGDERQSIYRFRGAEIEVYRDHRDQAARAGVEPIEFTRNYRSHPAVLSFVNAVFGSSEYFEDRLLRLEHAREEAEPPFLADPEPRVEIVVVDRPAGTTDAGREREAAEVAARFAWLRDEHGVEPSAMAILVRSWSRAGVFASALRERGFEVIVGGGDFLTRPEVLLARFAMAVIANPHDERSLVAVLASELGGLSATGLWLLASHAREQRTGLWSALVTGTDGLAVGDRLAAQRIVTAVSNARTRVGSVPLSEVILRAITELGYDLALLSRGLEGKQQFVNVLKVARLADAFETTGRTGMASFVEHLDAKEKVGDREGIASLADDGSPAVRIMSIHGSKGLEFPVVAVVGLADGTGSDRDFVRCAWSGDGDRLRVALKANLSSARDDIVCTSWFAQFDSADKVGEAEEEQRLAYVAATRARDYLLLSGGAPLAALPRASCTLSSILRALGVADELEPGLTGVHEAAGARLLLRCVDPVPSRMEGKAPDPAAAQIGEADLHMGPSEALQEIPPAIEAVSFSGLRTFLKCPRRYWAERVARFGSVASIDAEDRTDSALSFGSAVHAALQQTLEGRPLCPERLDVLARTFGLSDAGVSRLSQAVNAAVQSAAVAKARQVGTMRAETPFSLAIDAGRAEVRLEGSIDLYARGQSRAVIVDYKTGSRGGPAEMEAEYGLQARCYALAALADDAEEVEVFYVRPEVRVGEDIETVRFGPYTQGDAAAIRAEVAEIVVRMRGSEYVARPAVDTCAGCGIPRGLCTEAVG